MKKDKHGFWVEIAVTLGLSAILLLLPYIFYGPELKHVDKLWYVILAQWLVLPVTVGIACLVLKYREDPNRDKLRYWCIALAVVFAIITMTTASQYRADKSDNIQFDRELSK